MLGGMNVNNLIRRSGASMDGRSAPVRRAVRPSMQSVLADKEIIAAGSFTLAGGVASGRFARWTDLLKPWIAVRPPQTASTPANPSKSPQLPPPAASGVSYQWLRNGRSH